MAYRHSSGSVSPQLLIAVTGILLATQMTGGRESVKKFMSPSTVLTSLNFFALFFFAPHEKKKEKRT